MDIDTLCLPCGPPMAWILAHTTLGCAGLVHHEQRQHDACGIGFKEHPRARRTDENAGYFRMSAALPEGFPGLIKGPDTIAVSGASIRPVIKGIHKRLFQLDPPARIRWGTLFDEPVRGAHLPFFTFQ